jgi:hypothetical protein
MSDYRSFEYPYHHTDYRKVGDDLYKDAVIFGIGYFSFGGGDLSPAYWSAWYAGRKASIALLDEAKDMGLTQEQMERLQTVAAHVAYD